LIERRYLHQSRQIASCPDWNGDVRNTNSKYFVKFLLKSNPFNLFKLLPVPQRNNQIEPLLYPNTTHPENRGDINNTKPPNFHVIASQIRSSSDEFASVGGPGVEGTLMTYGPDPRNKPEAKAVVAEFRAKKFEPEAYTLYSYAGVQIIKQAAEAAKSADPKKVADMMHSGMSFKTVLGDIAYDKKGDITKLDYVMYIWKKDSSGKITYVECPETGCTM